MQLIRDISNGLKCKIRWIELVFLGPKLGYNNHSHRSKALNTRFFTLNTNMSSDLANKRWNSVDLHLKLRFQIFFNLFKVFFRRKRFLNHRSTSIHRLFVFTNLRWAFCNENEKVFVVTWIEMEIRTKKSSEYFVVASYPSGKCWTENKSVISLLLLLRFDSSSSILLILNFDYFLWSCLSSLLTMVNSHLNCRSNDSMMKILRWITENHHEFVEFGFEFWFWKSRVS